LHSCDQHEALKLYSNGMTCCRQRVMQVYVSKCCLLLVPAASCCGSCLTSALVLLPLHGVRALLPLRGVRALLLPDPAVFDDMPAQQAPFLQLMSDVMTLLVSDLEASGITPDEQLLMGLARVAGIMGDPDKVRGLAGVSQCV
jgi:hypothetical protein